MIGAEVTTAADLWALSHPATQTGNTHPPSSLQTLMIDDALPGSRCVRCLHNL